MSSLFALDHPQNTAVAMQEQSHVSPNPAQVFIAVPHWASHDPLHDA
jgi:hypothetical protein